MPSIFLHFQRKLCTFITLISPFSFMIWFVFWFSWVFNFFKLINCRNQSKLKQSLWKNSRKFTEGYHPLILRCANWLRNNFQSLLIVWNQSFFSNELTNIINWHLAKYSSLLDLILCLCVIIILIVLLFFYLVSILL